MNITETLPEASLDFPQHLVEVPSNSYLGLGEEAGEPLWAQVADSLPAVEALRPLWMKWTHTPNTDLDYYLHNLNRDSTIVRPYVITVWQDDIPQAMLVGQVRKQKVSSVVSFVNVPGPKVKTLELLAGGRVGRQSPAIDRLFIVQLRHALRSAGIDLLCFQRLPMQSDLLRELQHTPGFLMKERIPHIFRYSVAPLTAPSGKRAPALSGKNRREVR